MRLLLLAVLVLFAGCSYFDTNETVCTLELRYYTVRVVDDAGQPVSGLTTTIRNERTGEIYSLIHDYDQPQDGIYGVFADGLDVSRRGDTILFEARGEGLVASGTFEFFDDGCHVSQRSGPSEIVARPE